MTCNSYMQKFKLLIAHVLYTKLDTHIVQKIIKLIHHDILIDMLIDYSPNIKVSRLIGRMNQQYSNYIHPLNQRRLDSYVEGTKMDFSSQLCSFVSCGGCFSQWYVDQLPQNCHIICCCNGIQKTRVIEDHYRNIPPWVNIDEYREYVNYNIFFVN
jgi:hypothetical protein